MKNFYNAHKFQQKFRKWYLTCRYRRNPKTRKFVQNSLKFTNFRAKRLSLAYRKWEFASFSLCCKCMNIDVILEKKEK